MMLHVLLQIALVLGASPAGAAGTLVPNAGAGSILVSLLEAGERATAVVDVKMGDTLNPAKPFHTQLTSLCYSLPKARRYSLIPPPPAHTHAHAHTHAPETHTTPRLLPFQTVTCLGSCYLLSP